MVALDPSEAWSPILQGEPARHAQRAIERIAGDLKRFAADPRPDPPLWSRAPARRFSLSGGWAGIALFFAELDRAEPGQGHGDVALDLLDRAIEGAGRQEGSSGLYAGFPGVAWMMEHLEGRLFESEPGDDPGEEAAAALARHLERSPWPGDHELINGLAGFGAYALERRPRPWAAECLERVVARLGETAEVRPEGIAWRKPPEWLKPGLRGELPAGSFNLGVAHGVPGVIAVLAAAAGAGHRAARPLLDGAVSWLLAQKLPPGAGSIFPTQVSPEPGAQPEPSRLAWCYGDLGIACSLLAAARCVGEAGWEREALAIGEAAAARSPAEEKIADAGLCHGAAGIGHLFQGLYQASGRTVFAAAAREWLEKALDLERPGAPFGGFPCWAAAGPGGEFGWRDDPGFLMGTAGIGLVLLAAATPLEPTWNRILLISPFRHPVSHPEGIESAPRPEVSTEQPGTESLRPNEGGP